MGPTHGSTRQRNGRADHDTALLGASGVGVGLEQRGHVVADVTREADLEWPRDREERGADGGPLVDRARVGVCPELDLAGVQPLPDLVGALATFDVTGEGRIRPAGDQRGSTADAALVEVVGSDSDADVTAQHKVAKLEHDRSPQERLGHIERAADERRIEELEVGRKAPGPGERAVLERPAGELAREAPPMVVEVPTLSRTEAVANAGVVVERRLAVQLEPVTKRSILHRPGEELGALQNGSSSSGTITVSTVTPFTSRPPDARAAPSRNEHHMWNWTSREIPRRS